MMESGDMGGHPHVASAAANSSFAARSAWTAVVEGLYVVIESTRSLMAVSMLWKLDWRTASMVGCCGMEEMCVMSLDG